MVTTLDFIVNVMRKLLKGMVFFWGGQFFVGRGHVYVFKKDIFGCWVENRWGKVGVRLRLRGKAKT